MRGASHLRQQYRVVFSCVGLIAGLVGLFMLIPLLTVLSWPIDFASTAAFLVPGFSLLLGGLALWRHLSPGAVVLSFQEGSVIVFLSWLVACLAGAVPFLAIERLTVTQAVFESVSGWTTTGLSVVDVTRAPPAILLWRSTMQFVGGAGLAIVALAAVTGPGGLSLSAAEGRADRLVPNVRASAVLVLRMYVGYVAFGIPALHLAGMGWFDAVNHALCAVSTGGFSTRAESIGYWDSPAIEAIAIVLMLLGSLNFMTVWCLLRGRYRAVAGNGEIRLAVVLILVGAGLIFFVTCGPLYSPVSKSLRVALFETVSALTTTGYSTVGYGGWNSFGVLAITVLMLVGGGTCSTAGAIKQYRVYILFRSVVRDLRRPFLPRTAITEDSVWHGEKRISMTDAHVRAVAGFAFPYLVTWLCGAAVLAAHGYGLRDSLFEFASTLGTVGLSTGATGPQAPALVLWTQTAGMLLGRLEFFVVFVSIAKLVGDCRRMLRDGP